VVLCQLKDFPHQPCEQILDPSEIMSALHALQAKLAANVSPFSGGRAMFAIFAGERALATTAAMNAIDAKVYTMFCHQ
jgi:hypothetical protein